MQRQKDFATGSQTWRCGYSPKMQMQRTNRTTRLSCKARGKASTAQADANEAEGDQASAVCLSFTGMRFEASNWSSRTRSSRWRSRWISLSLSQQWMARPKRTTRAAESCRTTKSRPRSHCAHVQADNEGRGRSSLADLIKQGDHG
jgi:hypothetical protein